MKKTGARVLMLFGLMTMVLAFRSSDGAPIQNPVAVKALAAGQTGSFNQEQALAQLRSEISGKENQPAEQVFQEHA